MDWRKLIKEKPHLVLSVPVFLSCTSFITNLFTFMKDGIIDSNELHQLMSSVDGFETVLLAIIMFAFKKKKK